MKKFIICLIGSIFLIGVLTACGSSSTESSSAGSESTGTSVDETVQEAVNEVSCDVNVNEDAVAELIQIENVEIPAGSTAADFMKAIEHDTDKVNYVSYDLNGVDLDVPGEYTVSVSVNVPKDSANTYVDSADIGSDADTVNLITEFNVTVTESEANTEEQPVENVDTSETVIETNENTNQNETIDKTDNEVNEG